MTDSEILRKAHQITYPQYPEVYEEFDRLNELCFDGQLPTLSVRHGIMPYGKCIGQTRHGPDYEKPIISLADNIMADREKWTDTLIHEMLHAWLMLREEAPDHNKRPWCREIMRISPLIGLSEIVAEPTRQKRVDGKVCWVTPERSLTRRELATWPQSVRRNL